MADTSKTESIGYSGKPFGPDAPPLTELIKNILHRYPDGGQILKELIQNADDAGASEVKFLYDGRSFGTKYLASPELAKFQGPALYAFNDALFKESDWDGIRKLMQSNKEHDPMKVGRFGIGFNSVYHITDLPGIVSGKTMVFLDPQKKHFHDNEQSQPGWQYCTDLLKDDLRDQFLPFHGVFDCDIGNGNGYQATLFRFPLRQCSSKLSEKSYTGEMIERVFKSLREEAAIILLFMKNVQRISVYRREISGQNKCLFQVKIAQSCRDAVLQTHEQISECVTKHKLTTTKCIMDVQLTSDNETKMFKWLVVNQIGSENAQILELATKLKLLPWVGLAVPLNSDAVNHCSGRIFCFLPLPPDVDCETGLPVLVHGYFGLMDNRRGLVWPGDECQNNDTAEWNTLLSSSSCCSVYCQALEALVEDQPKTGLDEKQRCQLVYSTFPNPNSVMSHWRSILDSLFKKLLCLKFFYSQCANCASWITLDQGVLDQMSRDGVKDNIRTAVLETMRKNPDYMVITDLPDHISDVIGKYIPSRREITPALLRDFLRNSVVQLSSREDNLLLLEYILRDNPKPCELTGIPLLPLSSGTFNSFHSHCHSSEPSSSIYVPSAECPASLLPHMSHRFLDKIISGETRRKLRAMAATEPWRKNATQLVILSKDLVVENLRSNFLAEWFSRHEFDENNPSSLCPSRHSPEQWLADIWSWIRGMFPKSLEPFEGIPLIPLPAAQGKPSNNKVLGELSRHSKFIFASDNCGNVLPAHVSNLLTVVECSVLPHQPWLYHNGIYSYISPPNVIGVMQVLCRCQLEKVRESIRLLSLEHRRLLREFFSYLSDSTPNDQKSFLKRLPIFDTLNGSCTAVVIDGETLNAASSQLNLPSDFHFRSGNQLISLADPKSFPLLQILDVMVLKPVEVFLHYLFPDIKAQSVYSPEETSRIMLWILSQIFTFENQCGQFVDAMKVLPFVTTDEGQLRKPSELYDPSDPLLSDLFLHEQCKFPTNAFRDEHVISTLKKLGLRSKKAVTASELRQVTRIISLNPRSSSIPVVQALVMMLRDTPEYLKTTTNQHCTLKDALRDYAWIPRALKPPTNSRLPKCMPWFDCDTQFFAPAQLRDKTILIGSTMPIPDIELRTTLANELGVTDDPPVEKVIAQLKTAVQVWSCQDRRKASREFQEMLIAIYTHLSHISEPVVSRAIKEASLVKWIWHGNGFCSPAEMALEKDVRVDLRPQLFLLPDDLNDGDSRRNFFLNLGVRRSFSERDILPILTRVKLKHDSLSQRISSKDIENDLKLCREILEWLVRSGEKLPESLQESVFIPVKDRHNRLVLEQCKKCTYCDHDWLRQGGSELDSTGEYRLIHDDVPTRVAKLLGVQGLSLCLLSPETLGFEIEQTGPSEPLTTRLRNILQEYKEDVGIFKELIQNADDAGATKVRFLVDWRDGPTQSLLSRGMAECQGPALWAYNDGVFTDEDFSNINKLAGATKVKDLAKIGRFGLGFNAVYHVTDVPSFISREFLVVFDPNIHHLQGHIKDKSRPGIRVNLCKNPKLLSTFPDQFQPYHGVFDCDTQREDGSFHFHGTLFRFPLRTDAQAVKSEICRKVFNEEKIDKMIDTLRESASILLLFTQHVKEVELYELVKDNDPDAMRLVLDVKKSTLRTTDERNDVKPFIKECSDWWRATLSCQNTSHAPSRSELVKIDVITSKSEKRKKIREAKSPTSWLVCSSPGTGASSQLASSKEGKEHGFLPCAQVAVKLTESDELAKRNATALPEAIFGEAFCFLPLAISTDLPVHVNGSFAVTSNRRGIWKRSTSEQSVPIEARWNESLMEDALTNAYVKLLEEIKRAFPDANPSYHKLWPHYHKSSTWAALTRSFYSKLVHDRLPLLWSNGRWLDIHKGYIVSDELQKAPGVVETMHFLKQYVFELEEKLCLSLTESGQEETVRQRTLTLEPFYAKFVLPNIAKLPPQLQYRIVCFGLDCILKGRQELVSLFRDNHCIPCSEEPVQLAKPLDLINPHGAAAQLFEAEDNRFPFGEELRTGSRIHVLEELGMVKDFLSWREICERAKHVRNLSKKSYKRSLMLSRKLITYLNKTIESLPELDNGVQEALQNINFLPFIHRPPRHYDLSWKGSGREKHQFCSPPELFTKIDIDLVGSCALILDSENSGCGEMVDNVERLLGLSVRRPRVDQVLSQLALTIETWSHLGGKEKETRSRSVKRVCEHIYERLNESVGDEIQRREKSEVAKTAQLVRENLAERTWLFVNGAFVSNNQVACKWKGNGEPLLYAVPEGYNAAYRNLLQVADVRKRFNDSDFLNAIASLEDFKQGTRLTPDELDVAVGFLKEFRNSDVEFLKENAKRLFLPDEYNVLVKADQLTINSTPWLSDRGKDRFVHPDVTPDLAFKLGAKALIDRRLDECSEELGTAFGQHEKLTDRIKNILDSYPRDSGILKELVQNADDAQATEIHFIYDRRTLRCERVLQRNATDIQGPALCVYNDRPFSDKDLEGIQKLGIGSKRDDPEKTGQYGIGFNAVYHLTDCPSFLSNDDTLCILDPHCRYVRGATTASPGRKYRPITEDLRKDFPDTFSSYLTEYKQFKLKGSTVFRLPLRTNQQSSMSDICLEEIDDTEMRRLIDIFKSEAKQMLLFLNHLKTISLSEIDAEGSFKRLYKVTSVVDEKSEKKRQDITLHARDHKSKATPEVPWKGATYSLLLRDSEKLNEKWLIHQCSGVKRESDDHILTDVPNGRPLGLFPRVGVAALVSSSSTATEKYVAYCFLPLPVSTSLPVHVNGHFVLDRTRRNLWADSDESSPRTKWNNFMKKNVLATGYAALIENARSYMQMSGEGYIFPSKHEAKRRLNWYHGVFPDPNKEPAWKILATSVYQLLHRSRTPVLPVVINDEIEELIGDVGEEAKDRAKEMPRRRQNASNLNGSTKIRLYASRAEASCLSAGQGQQHESRCLRSTKRIYKSIASSSKDTGSGKPLGRWWTEKSRKERKDLIKERRSMKTSRQRRSSPEKILIKIRKWLSVDQAYFTREDERMKQQKVFAVLLRIEMPLLLFSPSCLQHFLAESGVSARMIDPKSVIQFLATSQEQIPKCKIGTLPTNLKETNVQTLDDLREIIKYCAKEEDLNGKLEGLPLLLTADYKLRIFKSSSPVYCSPYSDLFPDKGHDFLHPQLVSIFRKISSKVHDTCSPPVMIDLTVDSLARHFLPDVFQELNLDTPGQLYWDFRENGVLSREWFKRLWMFLTENGGKRGLHALGPYPVLPIKGGKLVKMKDAKSVLNATDEIEVLQVKKIWEILVNLECPLVCQEIVPQLSVLRSYIAQPHSVTDVLHVFDQMRSNGTLKSSRLDDGAVATLLTFFQDSVASADLCTLKRLPFFKAIDGNYKSLAEFHSSVLVPPAIPRKEMVVLQRKIGNSCLFLHSTNESSVLLGRLYKELGVAVNCTSVEFYIKYVLPRFDIFSSEFQVDILTHVRNSFGQSIPTNLEQKLRSTPCIPDRSGVLHTASAFYDPRENVFMVMFCSESSRFPPAPFNEACWLNFLVRIGLKQDCDAQEFLEFCRQVERDAVQSGEAEINKKRSKILVNYLFKKRQLRDSSHVLTSVSRVKFIAPDKVDDDLCAIHEPYQQEGTTPFLQFRDSVVWQQRNLAWTSAPCLPQWAEPSLSNLVSTLGIRKTPSVDIVSNHLKIVSISTSETLKVRADLSRVKKLEEVFNGVYRFFEDTLTRECATKRLSESCRRVCVLIGDRLRSVPCIFLDGENHLATGFQLGFNVPEKDLLKPYFYSVPISYGAYEHFLRRLGVTSETTALQMAKVLQAIKSCCGSAQMSEEDANKALYAASVFFKALVKERDAKDATCSISNSTELFLPSEDKHLVKSSELVCNVPPRLSQPLSNLDYQILFPLEECGLERARQSEYIQALPEPLRPRTLESLLCEELDPSCRSNTCAYRVGKTMCPFIERYFLILKSSHFRQGILRLLKHQKKSDVLDEEEREKAARPVSDKVVIKCVETVRIFLVDIKKRSPLTSFERACYVVTEGDTWTLYIKHEFGGSVTHGILSKAVNQIMGNCIEGSCISALTDIFTCELPSQIMGVLDNHDISRDFSEEDEELGSEVPEVYHCLMIPNPLCRFNAGARVAYREEIEFGDWKTDESNDSANYTLVKVIRCETEASAVGMDYDFNAEYLIDMGSRNKVVQVSVLDLFHYHQDKNGNLIALADDSASAPVNVFDEKSKIRKAVRLAKSLDARKRRKALRRLFLHFFRVKDLEVRNDLIDFLKQEATKLDRQFSSLFRPWRRQRERKMEIFDNFEYLMCHSGRYYFRDADEYKCPDAKEAERWIKQSGADLKVAKSLLSKSHSQVCFMCQQVVEKCLKAALYARCGIPRSELRTHSVGTLAFSVKRLLGAPDEVKLADAVGNYYLPTRYPDQQPAYRVPAEEYSKEQAREALEVAQKIFQSVETFVSN